MNSVVKLQPAASEQVALQPASIDIWDKKYRLKSKNGQIVDQTVDETFQRVAHALAGCEEPDRREEWYDKFLWALRHGAIPAGRILSNAGAAAHKPATSTINCTVSGTIADSMKGILQSLTDAGLTLRAGSGIGYEFSTLRPKGAFVAGAGAQTSGPLSFMDVFDKLCATIASAGGRRGAQMATFDVHHPDVMEFIRAKREDGRLRHFNLSLLITRDFLKAVRDDGDWKLSFPLLKSEIDAEIEAPRAPLDLLSDPDRIVWRNWSSTDGYVTNDKGQVACKVYRTIKARHLWNAIMASTYGYAEPGFILIDEANEMNNNWWCENIRATNPCGEQILPPNGACLLGSVNLTEFVIDPFTDEARFDWDRYREVVNVFTRMLDNVVEINGLPLESQREEIRDKRRHGMGFLGLGSTLAMLGIPYGSNEAETWTEKASRELALEGWRAGLTIAREKGPAPILARDFEVTSAMLAKRPEMIDDGYKVGDKVPGRILHARYSRYMQRLAAEAPELVEKLADEGARFTHHTSIAPTGTIALSMANNASNGIEPSFSQRYFRNVIREGKKTKEKMEVASYELLAYRHYVNPDATEDDLPEYFVAADRVTPVQHVNMQAAAQKWIDSSISKTANIPTEFPFADFKDIYMYAADKGLKGCTTFRFNPEVFQGVLVTEDDLKATVYEFTLDDGSKVRFNGDDEVEYDGEVHNAANLFDALKEGQYGRY
jgi:ribonucleoside-diphosphate reductase alpha chain